MRSEGVRGPAGAPTDIASRLTELERILIVIGVMLATIMEVIDVSIVNVAMPDMMGNLGATITEITWVSTAYIISNVIVLPLTSWLSDYFGRTRYLTYSVIMFTIASFGCGTSRSLLVLVLWRVVQGAGGAAFISTAQSTLLEIFPPRRRGQGQAMFSLGVVMAPTFGPTLGGYLTDHYSWPWIFLVNIPIGVVAAIMIYRYVPDSHASGGRRRADWPGIGLLAIGLGSLQTVLERGETEEWFASAFVVRLSILSVLGIVLFILWQLHPRNENPAVDLHVLRNRNLSVGTAYGFALGFFLYGTVFVIPQFLQRVQHHTAEQTGWLLMPGGIATLLVVPFVGRLVNRIDNRLMVAAGMSLVTLFVVYLGARLTPTTPDIVINNGLLIRGFGLGLSFIPLSLVTLGTLKPREISQGAAVFALARQLGGSVGIAFLATLLDQRVQYHWLRLSERLSAYGLGAMERVEQIRQGMSAQGFPPALDRQAALKSLAGSITGQAALKAYVDVFYVMTFVGLVALALVLLFQRPARRAPGPPPPDAH